MSFTTPVDTAESSVLNNMRRILDVSFSFKVKYQNKLTAFINFELQQRFQNLILLFFYLFKDGF